MNAEISETVGATILRLGMQIPKIPAQRKFVSAMCHAHSNADKPPSAEAPTVLIQKKFARPKTAHKLQKIVNMNADISETIKDREMGSQI